MITADVTDDTTENYWNNACDCSFQ